MATSPQLVRVSTEIDAPPAAVWARVSDHENTPSWVDIVKKVTLLREGKPRNGVGAIRRVEFRPLLWSAISEEIVHFEPPHEFRYVILKGMPGLVPHLGKLIVDDLGAGRTQLRWEIDFVFQSLHPFRLLWPSFIKRFAGVLNEGVGTLKRQLETETPRRADRG